LTTRRLQSRLYSSDNLAARRQHANGCQGATVHHNLVVHQNLELTVPSMDLLNVDPKLATESRRHTDGVYARDSIRAELNDYVGHDVRACSCPCAR
jgi:hypothetical protein